MSVDFQISNYWGETLHSLSDGKWLKCTPEVHFLHPCHPFKHCTMFYTKKLPLYRSFFVWCLVCHLTAWNLKLRWWKISWFSDSGVKVDYTKQWSSRCCYGCLCEDEYWLFLLVLEFWSANRIIDRGSLPSDNPFKFTPTVVKCFSVETWMIFAQILLTPHPHQIFRYSGSCNMVIAMKGASFHLGVAKTKNSIPLIFTVLIKK